MSNTKLYVGNLSFDLDEAGIREAFETCGGVTEVFQVMDKMTGRPRGFAFVTMDTPEGAQAAIERWDGQDLAGRPLKVNEARPKEPREGGFSGGGGGGRSFGGGGGGDRRGGGGGYGGDRRGGGGFGGDRRGGGGYGGDRRGGGRDRY